ncbi:MAG TPA: (2Fe-2S)-binding protein [Edaphobacter sp.]|jgi:D-hydroxyproline dehydrogenase subunit gamma|nr:(2Fe-2S)-binding protein [Edaphobacter sp.]
MPKSVTMLVNGMPVQLEPESMVSAALLKAGVPCRRSVTGEPRTALCGMGICFECRVTVNGVPHRRTCQLTCREGMVVETER